MSNSLNAEVLKLKKWPATWILGVVPVVLVAASYLVAYFVGQGDAEVLRQLLPEHVVGNLVSLVAIAGSSVSVIFAATSVGAEYGWQTLNVVLSRRQSRLGFLSGKLLAVGAALAGFSAVILSVSSLSSYAVAVVEDAPVEWPSPVEYLLGVGAIWLILTAWAAVGALFATLFESSAAAVGIGLIYALVLENIVQGLGSVNGFFGAISGGLIGPNSGKLAGSLGQLSQGSQGLADLAQPSLVLTAYVVGAVLLTAFLFRRRDVT